MEGPMGESRVILDAKEAEEMGAEAQETAKEVLSKAIREAQERGMTKQQIREILEMSEVNVN